MKIELGSTGPLSEMTPKDQKAARIFSNNLSLSERKIKSPLKRIFGHGKEVTKNRNAAVSAILNRDTQTVNSIKTKAEENCSKNHVLNRIASIPFVGLPLAPFSARIFQDHNRSFKTMQLCDIYLNNPDATYSR